MQSESGYHFIADYLQCQQKFFWRYIQQLVPEKQSSKLTFGEGIHQALAEYYRTWDEVNHSIREQYAIVRFKEYMTENVFAYQTIEECDHDVNRGIVLLNAYFDEYRNETMNKHQPEGVEIYAQRPLPSGRVLTGNIDLIPQNSEYIFDHKTTGWSISLCLQSLRISNQATAYLYLRPDKKAVVYNILYQNKSVNKFHREIVYKTPLEIDQYVHQADAVLGEISKKINCPQNDWWRNDRSCMAYNHVCEYFSLCKGAKNFSGYKKAEKEDNFD